MVVPDMKDAKKDIVLFLDDPLVSEAVDEAMVQSAAAAALCHVAGSFTHSKGPLAKMEVSVKVTARFIGSCLHSILTSGITTK